MISELYQKVLENELGRARYLLLLMIVGTLQILKQAKLEILAEALPIREHPSFAMSKNTQAISPLR